MRASRRRAAVLGLTVSLALVVQDATVGIVAASAQDDEESLIIDDAVLTGELTNDERAALAAADADLRDMVFPVGGPVRFIDDFHFPRDGGARLHQGNDLFADKHIPVVSVADGVVVRLKHSSEGLSGNMVTIQDADGFQYRYMHLNNDSPNTDDGANDFDLAFAPGLVEGQAVTAGELLGYVGDSGNAESTPSHVHFEIRRPDGSALNPYRSLRLAEGRPTEIFDYLCRGRANPVIGYGDIEGNSTPELGYDDEGATDDPSGATLASASASVDPDPPDPDPSGSGIIAFSNPPAPEVDPVTIGERSALAVVDSAAAVTTLADSGLRGTLGQHLIDEIVDIAWTADRHGLWLLGADGSIQALGTASLWGVLGDEALDEGEAVALAPAPDGQGYWVVNEAGRAFPFGSAGRLPLPAPSSELDSGVVDAVASPSGQGLHLLYADGTVEVRGDARFAGSVADLMPGITVSAWALTVTPSGDGYLVFDRDGRVFALGDAVFEGATRGGSDCDWSDAIALAGGHGVGVVVVVESLLVWAFGDARQGEPLRILNPVAVVPSAATDRATNDLDDDGDGPDPNDPDPDGLDDPGLSAVGATLDSPATGGSEAVVLGAVATRTSDEATEVDGLDFGPAAASRGLGSYPPGAVVTHDSPGRAAAVPSKTAASEPWSGDSWVPPDELDLQVETSAKRVLPISALIVDPDDDAADHDPDDGDDEAGRAPKTVARVTPERSNREHQPPGQIVRDPVWNRSEDRGSRTVNSDGVAADGRGEPRESSADHQAVVVPPSHRLPDWTTPGPADDPAG